MRCPMPPRSAPATTSARAAICAAIADGAHSLGALKQATKCSTTCGGCAPLATQILNKELLRLGVAVRKGVCEHFPYTRQELYHIVRVERHKTFEDIIAKHGQGLGCDICKPAVASILAACWNEYVLKKEHAGLQDTNDHFLANMQKDGTYSVIPRVPGGEITPEGLVALGTIAKKHGLYTKITGAQRIDHVRGSSRPAARRSGARWWMPASSPAMPMARPCARSSPAWAAPGAGTGCRTASGSPSCWSTATRGSGRRTRSRWRCRAAPASAPRPRARTWASSPPSAAGPCTSAATAA